MIFWAFHDKRIRVPKKKTSLKAYILLAVILFAAYSAGSGGTGIVKSITGGSGDLSSRGGWAQAFLAAAHLPKTTCNYNAVVAWEIREGGGFGNQAQNNPLNVNPPYGAGWPGYHATGAWAFPDAETGLRYTVSTLYNGNFGNILIAFRNGGSAQADCDAIMSSPWAESHYGGTLYARC